MFIKATSGDIVVFIDSDRSTCTPCYGWSVRCSLGEGIRLVKSFTDGRQRRDEWGAPPAAEGHRAGGGHCLAALRPELGQVLQPLSGEAYSRELLTSPPSPPATAWRSASDTPDRLGLTQCPGQLGVRAQCTGP